MRVGGVRLRYHQRGTVIETTYAIICDYCRCERYEARNLQNAKLAREHAHSFGWSQVDAGEGRLDRCPSCKDVPASRARVHK